MGQAGKILGLHPKKKQTNKYTEKHTDWWCKHLLDRRRWSSTSAIQICAKLCNKPQVNVSYDCGLSYFGTYLNLVNPQIKKNVFNYKRSYAGFQIECLLIVPTDSTAVNSTFTNLINWCWNVRTWDWKELSIKCFSPTGIMCIWHYYSP